MTIMAIDQEQEQAAGIVYKDAYRDQEWWWATWVDHAGRVLRRRLLPATEPERAAHDEAAKVVRKYISDHETNLDSKHSKTEDELWEIAQNADFPREPVAYRIRAICVKIARAEGIDEENSTSSQPGLALFADRLTAQTVRDADQPRSKGNSTREVYRILQDRERIRVGFEMVDRICCEFDLLLDEFIDDARAWADKTGIWEDRPGTEDEWPIGYVPVTPPPDTSIL